MNTNSTNYVTRSSSHGRVSLALILLGILAAVGISAAPRLVDRQGPSIMAIGIVTDSSCGSTHGSKAALGDKDCTRLCVMQGAEYALAVGRKIIVLQGDKPDLYRFAGERVRVAGKFVGRDIIAVDWVIPAPENAETATKGGEVATLPGN